MIGQRVSDEHWALVQAWAEQHMPSRDQIVDVTIASRPGWHRNPDGGVHVGSAGADAFREALNRTVNGSFWAVVRAGVPSGQILPAGEVKDFEGLDAGLCDCCSSVMWMRDPLNGRHARAHCSVCLAKSERNKKRAQRGTDLSQRICEACGDAFTPKRSHAKVCSPKCRAKLSRKKAKVA